jgi:hypothetical protein
VAGTASPPHLSHYGSNPCILHPINLPQDETKVELCTNLGIFRPNDDMAFSITAMQPASFPQPFVLVHIICNNPFLHHAQHHPSLRPSKCIAYSIPVDFVYPVNNTIRPFGSPASGCVFIIYIGRLSLVVGDSEQAPGQVVATLEAPPCMAYTPSPSVGQRSVR